MDFEALLSQLLQQRALQTKAESDAKHGPVVAQLRATKTVVPPPESATYSEHPYDNMPLYDYFGDSRGMAKPGPGMMMHNPPTRLAPQDKFDMGGDQLIPNYTAPVHDQDYLDEQKRMEQRMKAGRLVNNEVRREGHFNPALLEGLSPAESARRIADQLSAERERRGDPSAWWAAFAQPET